MMTYPAYDFAKARIQDSLARAEADRLRRTARTGVAGAYGAGVIDALGHGLIAIGARLVSDPAAHPTHRSAA